MKRITNSKVFQKVFVIIVIDIKIQLEENSLISNTQEEINIKEDEDCWVEGFDEDNDI